MAGPTPSHLDRHLDDAADLYTDIAATVTAVGEMAAGARSSDVEVGHLAMDMIAKLQDRYRAYRGIEAALGDVLAQLRDLDTTLRDLREALPRRVTRSAAA